MVAYSFGLSAIVVGTVTVKQAVIFSLIGANLIATCYSQCDPPCENNERCCGATCVQGISCVGVPCQTNVDCVRALTLESCCANKCVKGLTCPQDARIGRTCSSDSNCSGLICCNSKCYNQESCHGISCTLNSHCSQGQTCCRLCRNQSDCVGERCHDDRDCQEGEEKCCNGFCKKGKRCQLNYTPIITIIPVVLIIVIAAKRRARIKKWLSQRQTSCSGSNSVPAVQSDSHCKPELNQLPLEPLPPYAAAPTTTEFGGRYGFQSASPPGY